MRITVEEAFAIKFDTKPKWYEKIGMKFMFKEMSLEYKEQDWTSSTPYYEMSLTKTTLFYWISGYPCTLYHQFHSICPEDGYKRAKKVWETH